MKKINRSSYFGFGIIFAPKSKEYNAGIVINFMFWEFNHNWGSSNEELEDIQTLEDQINEVYEVE